MLSAGAAGLGALLAVPLLRFLLHPLVQATTQPSWKEIGNVEDLASVTSPVKKLVEGRAAGWLAQDRLAEVLVHMQGCEGETLRIVLGLPAPGMHDRLARRPNQVRVSVSQRTIHSRGEALRRATAERSGSTGKQGRRWQACSALPEFPAAGSE